MKKSNNLFSLYDENYNAHLINASALNQVPASYFYAVFQFEN